MNLTTKSDHLCPLTSPVSDLNVYSIKYWKFRFYYSWFFSGESINKQYFLVTGVSQTSSAKESGGIKIDPLKQSFFISSKFLTMTRVYVYVGPDVATHLSEPGCPGHDYDISGVYISDQRESGISRFTSQ